MASRSKSRLVGRIFLGVMGLLAYIALGSVLALLGFGYMLGYGLSEQEPMHWSVLFGIFLLVVAALFFYAVLWFIIYGYIRAAERELRGEKAPPTGPQSVLRLPPEEPTELSATMTQS